MSFADAIAVASAIVALVQFSGDVISGARQLYNSSQLKEHAELDLVQSDLDALLKDITSRGPEATRLGLDELASLCCKVGLELKDALRKLKAGDGGGNRVARMGRSVSTSLKTVLSKDKIKSLQQRLEAIRDEIQFRLVVLTSNRTEELVSAFAITHDQLLEVSREAAENAKEFKTERQEQYRQMTDMEKRLLDGIATQNHALYDLAKMLSAEAEQQHDQTREEMRSMGGDITEQNEHQHDQTRERIGLVDDGVQRVHVQLSEQLDASSHHTMHLTRVEHTVGDIRERIELQEAGARREKTKAAARERKERMWKAVNSSLNPVDRHGKHLRLTEGERAVRFAMAASLISLFYGSEALKSMRGPDGRIKLPIDASKMPEVNISQIKMPKIDFGKIKAPQIDASGVKRTLDTVGGHIQQTSVAGFVATRNLFRGLPKYFQAAPRPAEPESEGDTTRPPGELKVDDTGVDSLDVQVHRVELVDMELINVDEELPPPQPARPVKSSPRIAPKPPHLRSPSSNTGSLSDRSER